MLCLIASRADAQFMITPGTAPDARQAITIIERPTAGKLIRAHLDEENVPPAELPAAGAAQNATPPSTANNGTGDDWEQVAPGGNAAQSGAAGTDNQNQPDQNGSADANHATTTGHSSATAVVPPASPTTPDSGEAAATPPASAAPSARGAPSGNGAPPGLQNASIEAPDSGPPPALDIGAIAPGPDLSEVSLQGEIKQAANPALAASLRVTEEARKQLASGHTDDAIRELGRAVSIDPGNPFEYFYLGRSYIARRNYEQALTFFSRAEIGFAARPDWLGETVGFEGACYEELGKLPLAALAYQRAVGAAPNNLMARVGYTRMAANLPSPSQPTAEPAPAGESIPPPSEDSAAPAPAEEPPPPPPAPNGVPASDNAPVND
jgi:Tetratricopeptide repeat